MADEHNRPRDLRVWCELLPHAELVRPRSLDFLVRYGLDVALAVRPQDLGGLADVVGTLTDVGIGVALWPMLDDADGRWANSANASAFVAFAEATVKAAHAGSARAMEIVFDVEPPIDEGRRALALVADSWRDAWRASPEAVAIWRRVTARVPAAERAYLAAFARFREEGLLVSSALLPTALAGGDRAAAWERAIGVPHLADAWDHASLMIYTSLLEGWSRGVLGRKDAVAVLDHASRSTLRRFGARAGVSLGTVGVGAFGNEPVYRDPGELAADVAVVRNVGIERLALFDWAGVLARPPVEPWLDAFAGSDGSRPTYVPEKTLRATALLRVLRAVGRGVARFG
ncbi:MAG: hypothetical protein U0169_15220 [Polyangiaceae bacterium]